MGMKAMKASKDMKAMKAMRTRKVMKGKRVSKIAHVKLSKFLVLKGSKAKTVGGLTAKDLTKSKYGKIVSKKRSALGKKNKWAIAVQKARKSLGIKGFCLVGGRTPDGKALYAKAKTFL